MNVFSCIIYPRYPFPRNVTIIALSTNWALLPLSSVTQHFVQQFGKAGISVVSDLSIIESCQTVRDILKQPGSSCSMSHNNRYVPRQRGSYLANGQWSARVPQAQPQFAEDVSFQCCAIFLSA